MIRGWWTTKEIEELKKGIDLGMSSKAIAVRVGRTPCAVLQKAHTMGLHLRRLYDWAEIEGLAGEGKTLKEASEALGIDRHSLTTSTFARYGHGWKELGERVRNGTAHRR